MILKSFRIQKYKCFSDSGWVDIKNLTVLIGKNEVGKTSLLKALHKLNPYKEALYNMREEWPRGKRKERNNKANVCSAIFILTDEEQKELKAKFNITVNNNEIIISKNYNNELEIDTSKLISEPVITPTKNTTQNSPKSQNEELKEFLKTKIPIFVYMSEYHIFKGSTQLDKLKERKDKKQLTEKDKATLMILELSGLDLEEEVAKGDDFDREERQYDLDDASTSLTNKISSRWRQRKYEVKLSADGLSFFTFVRDSKDSSLIKLEERSKGFQWFFSFDLIFMYESKGSFRNCVLLLDEPGLHLHPEGQLDLIKRLREYSVDNSVIYTTHLPYMIDTKMPESIKTIYETENGAKITDKLTGISDLAKSVLQSALGLNGLKSFSVSKKNLIVEGIEDFWILHELSGLMERTGKECLHEEIFIRPAGGIAEAVNIATYMIDQNLDVCVLFDSSDTGREAKDHLVNKWLKKYNNRNATVLLLNEVISKDTTEMSIEDFFLEDYYIEFVKEVYKKDLVGYDLKLSGEGTIVSKTEKAFQNLQLNFLKLPVAKVLRKDLSTKKTIHDLSKYTREYSEKLFRTINKAIM